MALLISYTNAAGQEAFEKLRSVLATLPAMAALVVKEVADPVADMHQAISAALGQANGQNGPLKAKGGQKAFDASGQLVLATDTTAMLKNHPPHLSHFTLTTRGSWMAQDKELKGLDGRPLAWLIGVREGHTFAKRPNGETAIKAGEMRAPISGLGDLAKPECLFVTYDQRSMVPAFVEQIRIVQQGNVEALRQRLAAPAPVQDEQPRARRPRKQKAA